ncbi:MAG: hypothetical protein IJL34_01550 [Treponema sp.]|nr:hypothetical protein [bacterium]MBQ6056335.1 hypothetical protein [Treponema sp.]
MEYEQLGLFDEEYPQYKIDKPIRLIEAFGGIGSIVIVSCTVKPEIR